MTLLLLGDQLNLDLDLLATGANAPGSDAAIGNATSGNASLGGAMESDAPDVLMIEAHAFARRKRYHPHKLTLVFSAMRHFRDELRDRGHEVTYIQTDTFGDGLSQFASSVNEDQLTLRLMRPASHGAADKFAELADDAGIDLQIVENELFCTTPADWGAWAGEKAGDSEATYRQESWYRHVRRETGILMEPPADEGAEPQPVGGEWNYDGQNRETPPDDWEPPSRATFEPDKLTREVHDWVTTKFDTWGEPGLETFDWPVTRAEAETALEQFVDERLPAFGDYQDAMVEGEWALAHSLLSPAINLGLLHPMEAVRAAEDAYEESQAPINCVEGFIRQLLGWREFTRHVYREAMPELATANQLGQDREMPPAFWDGETEMTCLGVAVGHVRKRGYAHHIERLMVLSNFALLYGADPAEVNDWFHLGFVDAYHWVTTPNVVAMGSFGTDVLSSKPYASSANYINKMSDFCGGCVYEPSKTTGTDACPFNALYWDFLDEHEEALRGTGRMGLVYSHADKKDDDEWTDIRKRAAAVRSLAERGDL